MQKPNNAAPKPAAGRRSLWNYPLFSLLLALFCGFVAWLVVTVYFDPQGTYVVSDVPINYANSASTYTALGLDIVERPEIETVDVSVSGNSTIIGNLEASDILVYPSYAGVTGAGRATLRRGWPTPPISRAISTARSWTPRPSTSSLTKSARRRCPSRWTLRA